ncbi:hypothetical protein ACFP81_06195 [Deinococcus lacus]|uniref:Uncharacterized protein n=1 Tax=Deinococcus lacus TaxID=392561 RepID=A0ABW1YBQ2_9DEIO
MNADFLMCTSQECPSRVGCFRNAASGTQPAEGQKYADFRKLEPSIEADPPTEQMSCSQFLPAILADGTVQFPLSVMPTLFQNGRVSLGERYSSDMYRTLPPPYNVEVELRQMYPEMVRRQYIPKFQEIGREKAEQLDENGWEVLGFNI